MGRLRLTWYLMPWWLEVAHAWKHIFTSMQSCCRQGRVQAIPWARLWLRLGRSIVHLEWWVFIVLLRSTECGCGSLGIMKLRLSIWTAAVILQRHELCFDDVTESKNSILIPQVFSSCLALLSPASSPLSLISAWRSHIQTSLWLMCSNEHLISYIEILSSDIFAFLSALTYFHSYKVILNNNIKPNTDSEDSQNDSKSWLFTYLYNHNLDSLVVQHTIPNQQKSFTYG